MQAYMSLLCDVSIKRKRAVLHASVLSLVKYNETAVRHFIKAVHIILQIK
jgi:hypothetical protein